MLSGGQDVIFLKFHLSDGTKIHVHRRFVEEIEQLYEKTLTYVKRNPEKWIKFDGCCYDYPDDLEEKLENIE